jgi:hypothetical protein
MKKSVVLMILGMISVAVGVACHTSCRCGCTPRCRWPGAGCMQDQAEGCKPYNQFKGVIPKDRS